MASVGLGLLARGAEHVPAGSLLQRLLATAAGRGGAGVAALAATGVPALAPSTGPRGEEPRLLNVVGLDRPGRAPRSHVSLLRAQSGLWRRALSTEAAAAAGGGGPPGASSSASRPSGSAWADDSARSGSRDDVADEAEQLLRSWGVPAQPPPALEPLLAAVEARYPPKRSPEDFVRNAVAKALLRMESVEPERRNELNRLSRLQGYAKLAWRRRRDHLGAGDPTAGPIWWENLLAPDPFFTVNRGCRATQASLSSDWPPEMAAQPARNPGRRRGPRAGDAAEGSAGRRLDAEALRPDAGRDGEASAGRSAEERGPSGQGTEGSRTGAADLAAGVRPASVSAPGVRELARHLWKTASQPPPCLETRMAAVDARYPPGHSPEYYLRNAAAKALTLTGPLTTGILWPYLMHAWSRRDASLGWADDRAMLRRPSWTQIVLKSDPGFTLQPATPATLHLTVLLNGGKAIPPPPPLAPRPPPVLPPAPKAAASPSLSAGTSAPPAATPSSPASSSISSSPSSPTSSPAQLGPPLHLEQPPLPPPPPPVDPAAEGTGKAEADAPALQAPADTVEAVAPKPPQPPSPHWVPDPERLLRAWGVPSPPPPELASQLAVADRRFPQGRSPEDGIRNAAAKVLLRLEANGPEKLKKFGLVSNFGIYLRAMCGSLPSSWIDKALRSDPAFEVGSGPGAAPLRLRPDWDQPAQPAEAAPTVRAAPPVKAAAPAKAAQPAQAAQFRSPPDVAPVPQRPLPLSQALLRSWGVSVQPSTSIQHLLAAAKARYPPQRSPEDYVRYLAAKLLLRLQELDPAASAKCHTTGAIGSYLQRVWAEQTLYPGSHAIPFNWEKLLDRDPAFEIVPRSASGSATQVRLRLNWAQAPPPAPAPAPDPAAGPAPAQRLAELEEAGTAPAEQAGGGEPFQQPATSLTAALGEELLQPAVASPETATAAQLMRPWPEGAASSDLQAEAAVQAMLSRQPWPPVEAPDASAEAPPSAEAAADAGPGAATSLALPEAGAGPQPAAGVQASTSTSAEETEAQARAWEAQHAEAIARAEALATAAGVWRPGSDAPSVLTHAGPPEAGLRSRGVQAGVPVAHEHLVGAILERFPPSRSLGDLLRGQAALLLIRIQGSRGQIVTRSMDMLSMIGVHVRFVEEAQALHPPKPGPSRGGVSLHRLLSRDPLFILSAVPPSAPGRARRGLVRLNLGLLDPSLGRGRPSATAELAGPGGALGDASIAGTEAGAAAAGVASGARGVLSVPEAALADLRAAITALGAAAGQLSAAAARVLGAMGAAAPEAMEPGRTGAAAEAGAGQKAEAEAEAVQSLVRVARTAAEAAEALGQELVPQACASSPSPSPSPSSPSSSSGGAAAAAARALPPTGPAEAGDGGSRRRSLQQEVSQRLRVTEPPRPSPRALLAAAAEVMRVTAPRDADAVYPPDGGHFAWLKHQLAHLLAAHGQPRPAPQASGGDAPGAGAPEPALSLPINRAYAMLLKAYRSQEQYPQGPPGHVERICHVRQLIEADPRFAVAPALSPTGPAPSWPKALPDAAADGGGDDVVLLVGQLAAAAKAGLRPDPTPPWVGATTRPLAPERLAGILLGHPSAPRSVARSAASSPAPPAVAVATPDESAAAAPVSGGGSGDGEAEAEAEGWGAVLRALREAAEPRPGEASAPPGEPGQPARNVEVVRSLRVAWVPDPTADARALAAAAPSASASDDSDEAEAAVPAAGSAVVRDAASGAAGLADGASVVEAAGAIGAEKEPAGAGASAPAAPDAAGSEIASSPALEDWAQPEVVIVTRSPSPELERLILHLGACEAVAIDCEMTRTGAPGGRTRAAGAAGAGGAEPQGTPRLALLQLLAPAVGDHPRTAYLLDLLSPDGSAALMRVGHLLQSPGLLKILHAPAMDKSLLRSAYGLTLGPPLVNTQSVFALALAAEAGVAEVSPRQLARKRVGLGVVLESVGLRHDLKDKYKQLFRTNPHVWAKRPLTPEMIRYAVGDVAALPDAYRALLRRILSRPGGARLLGLDGSGGGGGGGDGERREEGV
ncbi:hypothetical protein HYH03_007099 [Edaphochlamys debaryana]|uniref:3'-5' exonuclease domain-containing protein n=1 Tax=Edaphochlamys debaryana TaxID=47281 RepID=A0A836C0U9_9CHLO|nr:hypothetical protein HYH03_007099 [Edaphochlamys debaryana]|eukprot:KAG2494859.1 hypothetical protein HYH03_007099 [Edaphochlamys debaryana]